MREIKEVIDFIQESTVKRYPLIGIPEQSPTLEDQLHDLIAEGKVPNDKAACVELYGEYPNDSFSALKYRLVQRLYNHLYFVDPDQIDDRLHHQDEIKAVDFYLKAVTLQKLKRTVEASEFFYKSYKIAEKLDLTEIKVINLRYLLNNALELRHVRDFENYEKALAKAEKTLIDELEARRLHAKIEMQLTMPQTKQKNVTNNIKKQLKRVQELQASSNSHVIFETYYNLSRRLFELNMEYDNLIALAEEAEELWRKSKINEKQFDHEQNKILAIVAHIRASKIREGLKLAEKYMPFFKEGDANWFAFSLQVAILEAHDKNLIKAYRVLENATRNKNFSKQSAEIRERYAIVQGFMDIVTRQKPGNELFKELKKYATEDEKEMRIDIGLLELMYAIQELDEATIESKAEELVNYSSKYLRIKENKRLKNIINLLAAIPKYKYNWSLIKDRSRYLFNNLQEQPMSEEEKAEVEVVPYDTIWDWALEYLRTEYADRKPPRKKKKTKSKASA